MDKPHSILIVDDEEAIRRNLRFLLADQGFRVLEATNGLEALAMVELEPLALVLTDLRMPEMDGLSLIAALVKNHPELPVIVISGVGIVHEAIEAVRLGAWDYLSKPLHDQEAVLLVIERALERARLMAENRRYRESLEELVLERTAQLEANNRELEEEVAERKRMEETVSVKQEQLAAMTVELSLTEERERRRIAAVLHDQIGQTLLLGRIKLGALENVRMQPTVLAAVDQVKQLIDQTLHDTRSLTMQLHPPMLSEAGLEAALRWLARQMSVDYGLQVEIDDDQQPKPLGEEMRSILYQAVRELLINVAKHAGTGAARLVVQLVDDMLQIVVADQGKGFAAPDNDSLISSDGGFGLFSASRRIIHLGGGFTIESAPGAGTRVTILAPLAETV